MELKRRLDIANEIALEAFVEQLDQYSASVMLGKRTEGGEDDGEQVS